MAKLDVDFCGLAFKNPIIVSSIEPTNSVDNLKKCIDAGAAGAVVKTLTDIPAMHSLTKHAKYAILNEQGRLIKGKVPRHYTFYSRSGYAKEDYRDWATWLEEVQAYARQKGAHIIASVGAGSLEGWRDISRMARDCGVSMLELNLGCPHPTQMKGAKAGVLICQNPQASADVTAAVVETVDIPVIVKLSPEAANLTVIAESVQKAGASAVTVNSRFTGFCVDIETGEPFIGGPAGVGGPWIKPVTLRWVHDIHSKLGMPIAGSNGIFDWRDAVEFIMSGARIMQIGSVLMLKGHGWLEKIISGLEDYLDGHGYPDVNAIYGLASKKATASYNQTFGQTGQHAVIDDEKCTRCWNCVRSCFYGALGQGDDEVVTRTNDCIGCELCFSVCPFDAVSFEENA
jgi:dihydroorotate dehydrogenase (fumarate)/dihydropyrimidine dehydrogenase (NAD+) subunit PreA